MRGGKGGNKNIHASGLTGFIGFGQGKRIRGLGTRAIVSRERKEEEVENPQPIRLKAHTKNSRH